MRYLATLFAATALLLAAPATAQITLEHTYADIFGINLQPTRLSSGRELYVVPTFNPAGSGIYEVNLYNLNHSLYRQVVLPTPTGFSNSFSVYYVSDKLFDTDTTSLEMLMGLSRTVGTNTVSQARVMRQDGTTLFLSDSTNARLITIYNTQAGAKMIIFNKVYSLPGAYTPVNSVREDVGGAIGLMPFPNPTTGTVQLPYQLRAGQVGTLVVVDATGREVKRMQVGAAFTDVLLDTRSLAPGVYCYRIDAGGTTQPGNRFVVE